MIVVSNTTPLIGPASIGRFELLSRLFSNINIRQLGILLKAKELGLVSVIQPDIERLRQQGFSLSQAVVDGVLQQANE